MCQTNSSQPILMCMVSGYDRVDDFLTAIRLLRCEKEFWNATVGKCEDLDIQPLVEKRQRKIPSRLDDHPETAVRLNQKDN